MNQRIENNHIIDLLFTLALFCVFAASALFVVVIGANVYQTTVKQMNDNYASRTSLSYIAEKIRQNDTACDITLGQVEGLSSLILHQTYEETDLYTYIYVQDGFLKELFIRGNQTPQADAGQSIMSVSSLTMEQVDSDLFRFTSTNEDNISSQLYVHVHADSERSHP